MVTRMHQVWPQLRSRAGARIPALVVRMDLHWREGLRFNRSGDTAGVDAGLSETASGVGMR